MMSATQRFGRLRAQLQRTTSFWIWHLALPLALGAVLLFVYPLTGLDDWAVGLFFDSSTHHFPLQHSPFFNEVLHTDAKLLVVAIGMTALGLWLWSFLDDMWRPQRRRSFWIFIAMMLSSGMVSLLKAHSVHHCPWDVSEYGGYAPHLGLFAQVPTGLVPGRCFPGGHASGGFALMAFYFGLRDFDARKAKWALWLGLLLGWGMGWTQTMRGAHFPSHTLWSAWVVWMVLLVLYCVYPPSTPEGRRAK